MKRGTNTDWDKKGNIPREPGRHDEKQGRICGGYITVVNVRQRRICTLVSRGTELTIMPIIDVQ